MTKKGKVMNFLTFWLLSVISVSGLLFVAVYFLVLSFRKSDYKENKDERLKVDSNVYTRERI